MTAPATLDLTPTWAGLLPALFAMLESGTGEGPGIARQELSRLAAWADSHIAQAKAGAADLARREEEAARRGRGLAADSLAGFARDFMTQGAFMRAACYWEAAARIAPAGMEAARDFRVSADLAEREAAALLSRHAAAMRKEGAQEARESIGAELHLAAHDSFDGGQMRAAGAFYRAACMAAPASGFAANREGMAQEAARIADSEALARREALDAARLCLGAFPPADLERQKGGAAWRDTSKDLRAALAELVAAFSSSPSSN